MIAEVVGGIKDMTREMAESSFMALAGELSTGVAIVGSLTLMLLTLNMLMQVVPASVGAFVHWGWKFVLISAAATTGAYFGVIYEIVAGVPDGLAGLFLGSGTSIEEGLQGAADALYETAENLKDQAGLTNPGPYIQGLLISAIGFIMQSVAVVVLSISYMGLGLSVGLAPIFICCLLSRPTSDLFGQWTRFTLIWVFSLTLTSVILGYFIDVLTGEIGTASTSTFYGGALNFIVLSCASIFFLAAVPMASSALAGSIASGGMNMMNATQGAGKGLSASAGAGIRSAIIGGQMAKAGAEAYRGGDGKGGIRAALQAAASARSQIRAAARTANSTGRVAQAVRQMRT
ncbi:MAG: type IV secretion system protein [Pseudomonadota bacterium]